MPRTKSDNLEKSNVIERASVSLNALGASTGVLESVLTAVTRGGKILSTTILGGLKNAVAGEIVLYGIMNADYSLAELEEFLELAGPLSPNDKVGMERASRGQNIRVLGSMGPGIENAKIELHNKSMSGLKFAETGESTGGWEWWFYNPDVSALSAASQLAHFWAKHFVQWNPSG